MKALNYRSSTIQTSLFDQAFMEAKRRLVGVRVQADLPSSQGGYQKGTITRITPDRKALIECDGSFGSVWVRGRGVR